MAKEFKYEVKKIIGKLGENSKVELRVVSWNDRESKLDVRSWWKTEDGEERCGKGISLTNDEAKKLVELLTDYTEEDEDDDF